MRNTRIIDRMELTNRRHRCADKGSRYHNSTAADLLRHLATVDFGDPNIGTRVLEYCSRYPICRMPYSTIWFNYPRHYYAAMDLIDRLDILDPQLYQIAIAYFTNLIDGERLIVLTRKYCKMGNSLAHARILQCALAINVPGRITNLKLKTVVKGSGKTFTIEFGEPHVGLDSLEKDIADI